ncbi:MAG: hypothetical protein ABW061_07775 [Polyangiaceae bacterium]
MRLANWTLTVGSALFVSGVVFIIAAARHAPAAPAAKPAKPAITVRRVADVKQIMSAITLPTVDVIFKSVSSVTTAAGVVETEPRTDQEWAHVAANAATLAESGNLLLTDERRLDDGDWVKMTRDMISAAEGALKATREKNKDALLDAGSVINDTCDTCHAKYRRQ